jgi:hypothetical protein
VAIVLGRRRIGFAAQPGVDVRAAFLPWPTATVTLRSAGTMSPPAKMPGWPVIMVGVDLDHAVADFEALHAVEQAEIDVLAERQHHRIGFERLELAGRLREALVVERHLLDHDRGFAGLLDGRQPLDHDAFLQRLFDLEVVRRHLVAGAAVDDDRLGAHALGGAGDVDGRVAAAIDHDAAAEHRLVLAFHAAQHRDGVDDLGRVAGRDHGALADVGADGEEGGVEAAVLHRLEDVVDLAVELDRRRPCRRCAASRHRALRAAGGTWECRSASCRRAAGRLRSTVTRWPRRRRW